MEITEKAKINLYNLTRIGVCSLGDDISDVGIFSQQSQYTWRLFALELTAVFFKDSRKQADIQTTSANCFCFSVFGEVDCLFLSTPNNKTNC